VVAQPRRSVESVRERTSTREAKHAAPRADKPLREGRRFEVRDHFNPELQRSVDHL
jgi:hypothetical protein